MFTNRLALAVSILCLLVLTVGCGSSDITSPPPPPPAKVEFLYLLTIQPPPTSGAQLMSFKLDPVTGGLNETSSKAMALTGGMVADPASRFLYLTDPDPLLHIIDIYSIDAKSGLLTPAGAFQVDGICPFCPPVNGPGPLAMDLHGKFMYYGSNTFGGLPEVVGGMTVNTADGQLNLVSGSPFPADDVPFTVLVHPSGKFLYTGNVPDLPSFPLPLQTVSGFSIDSSTGALTPVPGSPFTPSVSADAPGLATHPNGKFLYASTGAAANGILGWSIDSATGTLTVLPGSPFATGTTPIGVAISPSGKFLYSSNGAAGGIPGFAIDAESGALTPLSGSPFDTSEVLVQCASDPSGKLLLAVDAKNTAIIVFSIDSSTGALTKVGSPTPLGGIPWLEVLAKAP